MQVYKETQRTTSIVIWLLLAGVGGLCIFMLVKQLIFRIPVGDKPIPDVGLVLVCLIPFGTIFYFYKTRLYTVYDHEGIKISYFPFSDLNIRWEEVEKAEIIQYKFVGFGLRISNAYGTVYNIRGNTGLQLETHHGKFLIGTSHPDEVEKMLRLYCKR